jgi:hypothetical protein
VTYLRERLTYLQKKIDLSLGKVTYLSITEIGDLSLKMAVTRNKGKWPVMAKKAYLDYPAGLLAAICSMWCDVDGSLYHLYYQSSFYFHKTF